MIPRRITVEGFLCYKNEQVIDLDGCDLWVLSGRNGSGKSAIFDAMTFALFKTHRGGKQNADSLIHSDASALAVSFEFDLGNERYRVKRTHRRKGRVDRQVYRLEPGPEGAESWRPVPETDSERGLEDWVKNHIGLTCDTFTASVLLLQGQSERLIGAKPSERYQIVSGIVDMDRYVNLHERADARRRKAQAVADTLRERLRAAPEIDPAAIEDADSRAAEAQVLHQVATDAWKRLVELEARARQWSGLMDRRQSIVGRAQEFRALLAGAATIQHDAARLRDLDAALPLVVQALERRDRIEQLTAQSHREQTEHQSLTRKLDLIERLAEDVRAASEAITAEIESDAQHDREMLARQAALAEPIERVKLARKAEDRIRGLEKTLADHPADLAQQVETLNADHGQYASWKAALPLLETISRERTRLTEAKDRLRSSRDNIERIQVACRDAEALLTRRREAETLARRAEAQARDRLTEANTFASSAAQRLACFENLREASVCDRCGQELTPAHRETEAARLQVDRDQTARIARQAEEAARSAREILTAAETARAEADRAHRNEQQSLASAEADASKAEHDARNHVQACVDAHDALDDAFRGRVAATPPEDWSATAFPTSRDLDEGRRLAAGLKIAEAALKDARARLQQSETDRAKLDQERNALADLGLQPDDHQAEARYAALQSDREALAGRLKAHKAEKKLAEESLAQLDHLANDYRRRALELARNLDAAITERETLQRETTRALEAAPEGWRSLIPTAAAADRDAWVHEQVTLKQSGVEARAAALPHAQSRLDETETELQGVDAEIAAIPEEAQRGAEAISTQLLAADRNREAAAAEHQSRQSRAAALRADRDRRAGWVTEALAAERELAVAETLAGYLSWRGLQRDLIRDAERGIVDSANPILREFSGGELELRLLESDENDRDTALKLEVIERVRGRTGTRAVEFLSGSQKFRVAVSLALGIGQYARGGSGRPIESVIIDEGFGCLDSQGRDEMIEELNSLKGRLARIVLVSHQEEFAQAFRDGYAFEVRDGATVARPFHR